MILNYLISTQTPNGATIEKIHAKKAAFNCFIKKKVAFLYDNTTNLTLYRITGTGGKLIRKTILNLEK